MKITAVIPARYASTRFEGKALADIVGKPMVQHVYERTARAGLVSEVLVATDDERIASAVRAFGGRVEMTSRDHETGTDRLAEVAARLDSDIIVNVQGDEPLIVPAMIDEAIAPLAADPEILVGTVVRKIETPEELLSISVVKAVLDRDGYCLYFSRSTIPFVRDVPLPDWLGRRVHYKHIGLYVFRRDFLLRYTELPATPLESLERLEQLRILEHGYRIRAVVTTHNSISVDTPEDLEQVKKLVRGLHE